MSPVELQQGQEVARTIRRLAHEIVESNDGADNLVLVGLLTRGAPLAARLAAAIETFEGNLPPVGQLDVGLYRDDLAHRDPPPPIRPSDIPGTLDGSTVVLVDDVLFTGRTIRAAMDAIMDFGRPARVRLAVMVDRGHRELPIRPDFVGRNIPTASSQTIDVRLTETDGEDGIYLMEGAEQHGEH
ncbi:MAG: bifunctional pyr operon transcriptional regulator/uracil phosphoribosyltransferase [Dehalococcoidia bacterium]|nr:bifunctional pyr operon transcriptional regulator/uracil phosphoribosyltransferase [Dehalococcoidia bacterium]|tara:strand:+ start:7112 stop:7666 length:555 start_codon:yes stop_codon:yes gene_type:complete